MKRIRWTRIPPDVQKVVAKWIPRTSTGGFELRYDRQLSEDESKLLDEYKSKFPEHTFLIACFMSNVLPANDWAIRQAKYDLGITRKVFE